MSRTKKLTMARRRNRALAAENFSLLMACAEMQIQNRRLSAEMERIKEELRPAVERIAAIR